MPVHLPVHASWLNQVEIYFSILERKVLTPADARLGGHDLLDEPAERLDAGRGLTAPEEPGPVDVPGGEILEGPVPAMKCAAFEINATRPPAYFELLQGASSDNPPGQDGSTCYTTTWLIEVTANTIEGSCIGFAYSFPGASTHSLQYSWTLDRTGNAPGG